LERRLLSPHPGCALFDEKNFNAATANGKELIKGCRFHSCAYELTFLSDGVRVKVGPDGDTMFRLQAGNVAPDVTPELKKLTLE
jgi:hypothetical protein